MHLTLCNFTSGVLNQGQSRILALNLDSRNFGWRFAVQSLVGLYVVVEDLHSR